MATEKQESVVAVTVSKPNLQKVRLNIQGTAPYVQNKFSQKARQSILQGQMAGAKAKNKKTTAARDPEADYEGAKHYSSDGWVGIPASAFRAACIRACRLVGIQMTMAKMSIFVEPDGFDVDEGTPLVKIIGEPEMNKSMVRFKGTCSVAIRPMWREWSASLLITYDGDQFTDTDVANLVLRAGLQVGVGEGRPFSKDSTGVGWGTFEIVSGVE